MREKDAVIVGARCAGSPLAMLLARKGYSVLTVDKSTFPSDAISTHNIHQPGVALLTEWGLLDKVIAAGTPPITRMRWAVTAVTLALALLLGTGQAVRANLVPAGAFEAIGMRALGTAIHECPVPMGGVLL